MYLVFCLSNTHTFFIAYALGGVRERFSPITGKRYPDGVDHDTADDDLPDELTGKNFKPLQGSSTTITKPNAKKLAVKKQGATRRGNRRKTSPYPPGNPAKNQDKDQGGSGGKK